MKKKLPLVSAKQSQAPFPTLLVLLLTLLASMSKAQSTLLKDINTDEDIENNEFRSLTVGYNKIFFVNKFNELWKTTGNVSGTVRLKAFKQIESMTNVGEALYFCADDGTGLELWRSTGTHASTVKVKEFMEGPQGGNPQSITPGNGSFFFVATTAQHGTELWKSNGTAGGTSLVRDIQPGKRGSAPRELTFINGMLYFAANDGKNGYELWKSDGTAQGTVMVKDIRGGQYLGSDPRQLRNVNGTLYFTAYEPVAGRELWRSAGTAETTSLVSDIRRGSGSPDIKNLTAVNSTLFFSANDGIHGHELWKCAGSDAVLVKDLTPGKAGSHGQHVFEHPMTNFTNVGGQLFFTAYGSGTYYIWKSDGTEAGTRPLEEAQNGISTPVPQFVAMGSSIYYYNTPDFDAAYYGTELRKMNANGSGSVVIAHLVQPDFYTRYVPELATMNHSLYLIARNDEGSGFKLFRSNGTPGHLLMINDSHKGTQSSSPYNFVPSEGGQVFFAAEEQLYEQHSLWRTDGTPGGTIKLTDQQLAGSPGMVSTKSTVYFSTYPSLSIWKTNGTPEGTHQVVSRAVPFSYVRRLASAGEMLYIHMDNQGLWRSNGTEGGTFQLTPSRDILFMKAVGNLLFYLALQDGNRLELWRTNGQRSQTYKVLTFTDPAYPASLQPVTIGNLLYFIADDGVTGHEVWRSDGTIRGTFRIGNLNTNDVNLPAYSESDIGSMAAWQGHLYISAVDDSNVWGLFRYDGAKLTRVTDVNRIDLMIPANGRLHLFPTDGTFFRYNHWVTDGTAEGTQRINDFGFEPAFDYLLHDDVLYVSTWGGTLWRSDGTACGTFPIDVGVGMASEISNVGDRLIFPGSTMAHGIEPYVFNLASVSGSPCQTARTTQGAFAAGKEMTIDSYPNPFVKEFIMRVPGGDTEVVEVQVFTNSGFPVETISGLSANKEYRLGALWKPGSYILRINQNGRVQTYHVLKE